MRRRFFVLMALTVAAQPASAEMCTLDAVPAATLLLPYFEVDLDDVNGVTTLFSINNAASEPALARLIFWTDWSYPTIGFDVFLTGYDTVTVNLRDVFGGFVAITADEQSDPSDTISPHGRPEWDGSFDFCDNFFPFINPAIAGAALNRLVNGHLGNPIPFLGGDCVGADHGDGVARGYLTIDSTTRCSLVVDPSSSGYFIDGGVGVADDRNVLWGDYFYRDPGAGTLVTLPMIHVEADSSFSSASTATGATFYGTHLDGDGRDNREPLGTAWGTRYLNGIGTGTDFVVWRDTTHGIKLHLELECGQAPLWFPLAQEQVACFDEMETSTELCVGTGCFPLATQRIPVSTLDVPFTSGWCSLNLNHGCPACSPGGLGAAGVIAQSVVAAVHTESGSASGGLPAVELAHACDDANPLVDSASIFTDGFESGNLSAWSAAVP